MQSYQTFTSAAAATGLVDKTSYWIAGSTVIGDTGAGWFVFSSGSSATGSNDVIVITAGGRLLRVTADQSVYATQSAVAIGSNLRAGAAMPVKAILPAGTNRSGTITTGGTAQQLAAANTARTGLDGQNISAGDLWINEIGGTAAADTVGSFMVTAGSAFDIATNQAISIVGATTGQKFSATEV